MTLDELKVELGIESRRIDEAIRYLVSHPAELDGLIRHTGLTRRLAERVLAAFDETEGAPALPAAAVTTELTEWLQRLIENAPAPKRQLDHVSATADTLARRAVYLAGRYALSGRRVLFLGDHDLTSFALARVQPDIGIVVADIDDELLDYMHAVARREQLPVVLAHADFAKVLPSAARDVDLVVTDPPYTPEGIGMFVARAIEALAGRSLTAGRVVMAYGYSPQHPALGLNVQRMIGGLECAIEYALPEFNIYDGAQAIGGRSDLYCLAPTAGSLKAAQRLLAQSRARVYTHGTRSVESGGGEVTEGESHISITHSLVDDHESALLRALLRATAPSVAIVVPNSHPDIASEHRQRELTALVAPRYRLRFLRSRPSPKLAIVVGESVAGASPGLIAKPNTTLATALADRAYKAARVAGGSMSRTDAAEAARVALDEIGPAYGGVAVADLPRAVLRGLT